MWGDLVLWAIPIAAVVAVFNGMSSAFLAVERGRPTAWLGLASCFFLSFFVPLGVWIAGASLLLAGLVWKTGFTRLA